MKIQKHNLKLSWPKLLASIFAFFVLMVVVSGAGLDVFEMGGNGAEDKRLANRLFHNFVSASDGSSIESLDKLLALGLSPSHQNTQKLHKIVQSQASLGGKSAAIRLLGQQYTESDNDGLRQYVRSMFLNLLNSPQDKSIHEAVVLTYSRLDYFPDSIAILAKAHAEKIIDDDKYYGNLAHLAPVAPREAQALILDRILKSKNAYAFDIVASYAASDSEFFRNGHSKLIGEVLRVGEPRFASDPSAVGAIELIKYATWIKATAKANQFNTGQPANWFVENELLKMVKILEKSWPL